jgi:hypothetical protein
MRRRRTVDLPAPWLSLALGASEEMGKRVDFRLIMLILT